MKKALDNPSTDYFNDDLYLDDTAARELWIQVLARACLDASNNSLLGDHIYYRSTARTFLTSKSDHFMIVCENANVSPQRVYEWAIEQKKQGWPAIQVGDIRQAFTRTMDSDNARRKEDSMAQTNNVSGSWGLTTNDNFSLKPVYERFA